MVPVAERAGREIRTLTVSCGLVWWIGPAQLPASAAGTLAEGSGVGSRVAFTWGVVAVGAAGLGRGRKTKTAATTIAITHTAQATAQMMTPERDRIGAGWRMAGVVLPGTRAAALACLVPSASRPEERSCPRSSRVSTVGPTGRRPTAAKMTVLAQAPRSAAGVAAP